MQDADPTLCGYPSYNQLRYAWYSHQPGGIQTPHWKGRGIKTGLGGLRVIAWAVVCSRAYKRGHTSNSSSLTSQNMAQEGSRRIDAHPPPLQANSDSHFFQTLPFSCVRGFHAHNSIYPCAADFGKRVMRMLEYSYLQLLDINSTTSLRTSRLT